MLYAMAGAISSIIYIFVYRKNEKVEKSIIFKFQTNTFSSYLVFVDQKTSFLDRFEMVMF